MSLVIVGQNTANNAFAKAWRDIEAIDRVSFLNFGFSRQYAVGH